MTRTRPPAGYTIFEMLIVIAVSSLLLTLVTMTFSTLLRLGDQAGRGIAWQQSWHRLSLQWREDVHSAHDATMEEEFPAELRLSLSPEESIEYNVVQNGVTRTLRRDEKIVGSDLFRLSANYAARISLGEANEGRKAVLTLFAKEPSSLPQPALPLRIEAQVGLDGQRSFSGEKELQP